MRVERRAKPMPNASRLSRLETLAEQIRRGLTPPQKPAPLRHVTCKLPPELDEQVEIHCVRSGQKKQDVIRDALLLYFEAVREDL